MRHLNVECRFLKKLFFSQKWSFLIKCLGRTSHESISKVIFFLSVFIRHIKQAQTFNSWTSAFEEISKMLKNFEARPSALKIMKSLEQKLFLISVRIFCDYSSSQFLRISISLHPMYTRDFRISETLRH
jgi:hypothetical protein